MPITIGSNIASLQAQRGLAKAGEDLSKVFERLSSGLRINRAADDPAGLAVASSLNADARVFTQGLRNLNDGSSLFNIAEGALSQIVTITGRQQELAEQSANGTYSRSQRMAIQKESDALADELNRIVGSTEFNGVKLFNLDQTGGQIMLQLGRGSGASQSYALGQQWSRTAGTGNYKTALELPAVGSKAWAVDAADLNRDGLADLVASEFNSVSVRISNGDGTFLAPVSYAGAAGSMSLAKAADLNGDGTPDLVYADNAGLTFVRLGTGSGTFGAMISTASGITAMGGANLGDANNDGRVDVLITGVSGFNSRVLLGNGDGTFTLGVSYSSTANARWGELIDINDDAKQDMVTGDIVNNYLSLQLGQGDGTFGAVATLDVGCPKPYVNGRGDFNRDGREDLLIAAFGSGYSRVLLSNGDGTFKQSGTAHGEEMAAAADFNGDGYLDYALSDSYAPTRTIHVDLGNGDGTFTAGADISTGSGTWSTMWVAAGDFNGDGVKDIAGADYNDREFSVLLAQTNRTATVAKPALSTQSSARSALSQLQDQLSRCTNEFGAIGAAQSRIGVQLATLTTLRDGYSESAGRISSADIAAESSNLIREQILQQAGAAVLAQANQQPGLILQLLKS